MTTYLVTGGCGFIGSHLVDKLLESGHKVVVLDDLSTGNAENVSSKAELIIGDICNKELVTDLLARVDACFHLAAWTGMIICKEDWLGTNRVNLVGTITLFEAASAIKEKYQKVIPFVFASSSAVYGECKDLPLKESAHIKPLSAYGADKLACEMHAYVASKIHNIPTICLRYFNVYGTRQSIASVDSAAIPIFIEKIKQNQPIDIFGDGEQTRDFIHVSDVVNYTIFFMNHMKLAPNVFNVCTGKAISINELVNLFTKILNRDIEKKYVPTRLGDVVDSCGDPSKAEKLGIKAKIPLLEGLTELLRKSFSTPS